MDGTPIEQLLAAVDRLDVEAVMALLAPDPRFLLADGRRAQGSTAVHKLLTALLSPLHSTSHRITAQWHPDDVWVAEVVASYELQDRFELNDLPRAFVLRMGAEGIEDVRVYGAHEHPISEHRTGEEGMRVAGRWIPPL